MRLHRAWFSRHAADAAIGIREIDAVDEQVGLHSWPEGALPRPEGELAEVASRQSPPPDPPLKRVPEFRLIGKPVKRVDGPDIVRGRAAYGLDALVPGMLVAVGLPTAEEKKDSQRYAKDESPWGAFDTPYRFGGLKVDYVPVDSPVPSGSWRAVEYPSRVFAREGFLDEAAHALGQDPIELRLRLLEPGDVIVLGEQRLDRGRMMRVLEEARERAGWKRPLQIMGAAGRLAGRGIAIGIYHAGSYMAQVAEVSAAPDLSEFRVHRVVCVLDCGIAINPLGIEGQVESGIAWGLSAALHGKIDFRQGRVVQQGYHDFRVMQMGEMPVVETHILPSEAPPGGFGEHAVPPVAPAVANALFAATGKRLRKLPLRLR